MLHRKQTQLLHLCSQPAVSLPSSFLPKDVKNQRNGSQESLQESWRKGNKATEGKQARKSKGQAEGTLGWVTPGRSGTLSLAAENH